MNFLLVVLFVPVVALGRLAALVLFAALFRREELSEEQSELGQSYWNEERKERL